MEYDYRRGKQNIENILNEENDVEQVSSIPLDNVFDKTGYYGKVTSIFVDIRKSTKLFSSNKKTSVAKTIKCFSSEIFEILSQKSNLREIGVRGDCVYAIYSSSLLNDDIEVFDLAVIINTYLKMLNKLLAQRQMKTIRVGIGISTAIDLVVKANKNNNNINSKVWIGKGVTYAAKLSSCANHKNKKCILLTSEFYNNIKQFIYEKYPDLNTNKIEEYKYQEFGVVYGIDLYNLEFDNWIEGGMKK